MNNPSLNKPSKQATDKQVAYIKKLLDMLGGDRPFNYATMTKDQASQIIDELKPAVEELNPWEGNGYD